MQVYVFHWQYLTVSAARRATLNPKHGSKRRLTQCKAGFCADKVHSVGKSDTDGSLAFPRRSRVYCSNKHEFCVFLGRGHVGDFRFVVAVQLDFALVYTYFLCNIHDGLQLTLPCNFNIRHAINLLKTRLGVISLPLCCAKVCQSNIVDNERIVK